MEEATDWEEVALLSLGGGAAKAEAGSHDDDNDDADLSSEWDRLKKVALPASWHLLLDWLGGGCGEACWVGSAEPNATTHHLPLLLQVFLLFLSHPGKFASSSSLLL